MRPPASQLPDHLQFLGLPQTLFDLPALGNIPDRPGQPDRTVLLVPVQSTFGDNPAGFVLAARKLDFNVEFPRRESLFESPPELSPVARRQGFSDCGAPSG